MTLRAAAEPPEERADPAAAASAACALDRTPVAVDPAADAPGRGAAGGRRAGAHARSSA